MKPLLLLASFLLFAVPSYAQRGAGGGGHFGSGGSLHAGGGAAASYSGGAYGGGDWFGSEIGPSDFSSSIPYEAPNDLAPVYGRNDGPFVPSTFMNYRDAVSLGKQMLAGSQNEARSDAEVSLGEFARSYRANKVPTLRLRSRIVQDAAGKLQVCNLNGNDCHGV